MFIKGVPKPQRINIEILFLIMYFYLSYDVISWSEILPRNKIDKPLAINRFMGKVMMSIKMLRTLCHNYDFFTVEMRFQSKLNVI